MNRFFDIPGDVSMQLAPWEARNRGLDWTKGWYELQKQLRMRSDIAGGVMILQPTFVSDLASIPKPVWSLFMGPNDPRIALGAWFHDLLYGKKGKIILECGKGVQLSRKQADHVLAFEAMPDLMASRADQHAVYQALRRFGDRWDTEPWTERFT